MKCPICDSELEYRCKEKNEEEKTHVWVCSECPCVIFEYWDEEDVDNLQAIIK